MNIKDAKEEIKRTYYAYMQKDEYGNYLIPAVQQRPILLIGPPGIGKTAIMRQIAQETGCGLLSYTMTHHTRQSAIGLPFISKKVYGGREYSITEYTMSEIVASVYDYMENTGKTTGILFLDEINCVSETLSPVMLQLLQNKTFGNHPIPEGWMITAAGNPSEYNKSVRDLDMATMDRVKHIEVEADLNVWLNYALQRDVHPAVRTYLNVCPDHFYRIEPAEGVPEFVTARGWEDLSAMLYSREKAGYKSDTGFFLEYLQHTEIAHSFSVYYDLFCHFSFEKEEDLFARLAKDTSKIKDMPAAGCLSLGSLLFHHIRTKADSYAQKAEKQKRLEELILGIPKNADLSDSETAREFFETKKNAASLKEKHGIIDPIRTAKEFAVIRELENDVTDWIKNAIQEDFTVYEEQKGKEVRAALKSEGAAVSSDICNSYGILSSCAQGENSLLYLTSDLSRDNAAQMILKEYPCPEYEKWHERAFGDNE